MVSHQPPHDPDSGFAYFRDRTDDTPPYITGEYRDPPIWAPAGADHIGPRYDDPPLPPTRRRGPSAVAVWLVVVGVIAGLIVGAVVGLTAGYGALEWWDSTGAPNGCQTCQPFTQDTTPQETR